MVADTGGFDPSSGVDTDRGLPALSKLEVLVTSAASVTVSGWLSGLYVDQVVLPSGSVDDRRFPAESYTMVVTAPLGSRIAVRARVAGS